MNLDFSALLPGMLEAASGVLKQRWPQAKVYAESEFRKIGESIELIGRLYAAGEMTQKRARLHLEFQRSAARNVLLAIKGIGIVSAEQAINAALSVVRDTVNTAIGFRLI